MCSLGDAALQADAIEHVVDALVLCGRELEDYGHMDALLAALRKGVVSPLAVPGCVRISCFFALQLRACGWRSA